MLRKRKGLNNAGRKNIVNEERKKYPKLGENIMYKEKGKAEWIKARVFRVFKKNSKYKYCKQLILEDGSRIEKDFENDIDEWKTINENEENGAEDLSYTMEKEDNGVCLVESFPVEIIQKANYNRKEVHSEGG